VKNLATASGVIHWAPFAPVVPGAVIDALYTGGPGELQTPGARFPESMRAVLPSILSKDSDREKAVLLLQAALRDGRSLADAVAGLLALSTTSDREGTRAILHQAIVPRGTEGAEGVVRTELITCLLGLTNTEVERQETRDWLADALDTAGPDAVRHLSIALLQLDPTERERLKVLAARARAQVAVLTALRDLEPPWSDIGLVSALVALSDPGAPEIAEARVELVSRLDGARGVEAPAVVDALLALSLTPEVRTAAVERLQTALLRADAHPYSVVSAMAKFHLTDSERDGAAAALMAALADLEVESNTVQMLAGMLRTVAASEDQRTRARQAIAAALDGGDPDAVVELASSILDLHPTSSEQATLRVALHTALTVGDLRWIPANVMTFLSSGDSVGRSEAIAAMLAPSQHEYVEGSLVSQLVSAVFALGPSEIERANAIDFLLSAMPSTKPDDWGQLLAPLLGASLSRTDLGNVRARLLHTLRTTGAPYGIVELAAILCALPTTESDREETVLSVLAAIPRAYPDLIGSLLSNLLPLLANNIDRERAREAILAALPAAVAEAEVHLVSGLRAVSTTEQWLDWLAVSNA